MSYIIVDDNSKQITLDNFNDVSTKYVDPSDADITAEDVRDGKIAYGAEGKIIGTASITPEPDYFRVINLTDTEGTVILSKNGNAKDIKLKTSIDGINWTEHYLNTTTTFTLPANGYVMFDGRENIGFNNVNNDNWRFSSDRQHNVAGDLGTLLDLDYWLYGYDFYRMFNNNTTLISAEDLFISTKRVGGYSFGELFRGCTSLIKGPRLPYEVSENSYGSMFYGCTSLSEMPELPSMVAKSYCYESMFVNCRNLSSATLILPATTAYYSSYRNMISGTNISHIKCMMTQTISGDPGLFSGAISANGLLECAVGQSEYWRSKAPASWTIVEVSE